MAGEGDGFGTELRRLRESKGLTLATLADKVGIKPKYLGHIETGIRTGFGPALVYRLSRELGVSCEHWARYFTGDSDTSEPAATSPVKSEPAPVERPMGKRK